MFQKVSAENLLGARAFLCKHVLSVSAWASSGSHCQPKDIQLKLSENSQLFLVENLSLNDISVCAGEPWCSLSKHPTVAGLKIDEETCKVLAVLIIDG